MRKNTIKFIAACALFTVATGLFTPVLAGETVKATVNGMVCAFCAQGIEKRLSALPATQHVWVDLKQKVVAVEAKEGQTLDRKAIRTEITDAGYDVVQLETASQSVAELRATMKGSK